MLLASVICLITLFVLDVEFSASLQIIAVYQSERFTPAASNVNGPRTDLHKEDIHFLVQVSDKLKTEIFQSRPNYASIAQADLVIEVSIELFTFKVFIHLLILMVFCQIIVVLAFLVFIGFFVSG